MVAREAEAGLGGLDEEAAGAGHVVVDGDKADPDWTDGDGFAVRYARSCWMPPGKVAGAVGRRPDRLHGGGVVERDARAEEGNQAGVVQVHVRDEEVRAPLPSVPPPTPLHPRPATPPPPLAPPPPAPSPP